MQRRAPRPLKRARRLAQQGLVTLLFLLILLSAGAYFLLRALNQASPNQVGADQTTQRALNAAREALLGYAVRYPDNPDNSEISLAAGPGRLPCPDTRLDKDDPLGAGDSPCASSSKTETGRFPWHNLDMPELVDGSGAPLWYAVSDKFRAGGAPPLNSQTPGTFQLVREDKCSTDREDVVALVMAPGPALEGQNRAADSFDASAYLEDENASKGDNCFSTKQDAAHNDQVLVITRQELMDAVERRVLEDVANALSRYEDAHDGYPWLSPFTEPTTNHFQGQAHTRHGSLPLRRFDKATGETAADLYGLDASSVAFDAPFTLRWSIPSGGTVTTSGDTPPPIDECLRDTNATCPSPLMQGPVLVLGTQGGEWAGGRCKAQVGGKIVCRAVREVYDASTGSRLRRTYTVVLTNWIYTIDPPTADATRRQNFSLVNGTLGTGIEAKIELKDEQVDVENSESSSVLTLPSGTLVDSFELAGVPFDLEVDDNDKIELPSHLSPGELAQWLVANEWHHLLYVAFRAADAPDGAEAADCAEDEEGAGCLIVNWSRLNSTPVSFKAEGVILGAGAALKEPIAQARPGNRLADYFEAGNADESEEGKDSFDKADETTSFNDRVRVLGVHEDP